MKWNVLCPLLALLSGCCGLALRLWQNSVGFDPATGLPIPGALPGMLLPGLLLLAAVAFWLLLRRLPCRGDARVPLWLPGGMAGTAAVLGGTLLLAFSGGMELSRGLSDGLRPELVAGLLSLLCAGAMLALLPGCKRGGHLNGSLLLLPAIFYTLRLVLFYRAFSSNPVLASYYVEILALSALILSYFQLASFWFQNGNGPRFSLSAMLAALLCLTAVADCTANSTSLGFFAGNALLLLGFLILCLGDATALPGRKGNRVKQPKTT